MSAPPAAGPGQAPSVGGLFRQFGWYTAGQALRFVVGFAQVPLFALTLAPAEFGRFVTVQVVAAIVQIVGGAGLPGGLFRQVCDYAPRGDRRGEARAMATATAATLMLTALVGAVAVALAMGFTLAGLDAAWVGYAAFAAVIAVAGVPRQIYEQYLRAAGRARDASAYLSLLAAVSLAFSFFALVPLDGGVRELLAASLLAQLATSAIALPSIGRSVRAGVSRDELQAMLSYSLPLVPALLIDWVTEFSDRLILGAFAGLGAVGVYGLAGRLARSLHVLVNAGFQAAWDPWALTSQHRPGSARLYGRLTTYLAGLSLAPAIALAAASAPVLALFGGHEEYSEGAGVVFPLALAYWFALMRHIMMAPLGIQRRTDLGLIVFLLIGFANIVLNFALIPPFGAYGAAWATLASHALGPLGAVIVGRRLWVIQYEWGRLAALLAAGIAGYALALALPAGPTLASMVLGVAVALAPLVGVAGTFLLAARDERMAVMRAVSGVVSLTRVGRA